MQINNQRPYNKQNLAFTAITVSPGLGKYANTLKSSFSDVSKLSDQAGVNFHIRPARKEDPGLFATYDSKFIVEKSRNDDPQELSIIENDWTCSLDYDSCLSSLKKKLLEYLPINQEKKDKVLGEMEKTKKYKPLLTIKLPGGTIEIG